MIERPIVEIAPKTWLISDYKLDNFYLLEGEEKALLIDTGAGLGPVEDEVRKLTKKPLVIAATHGHGDHIGGSHLFEEPTYLCREDMVFVTEDGRVRTEEEGNAFRERYARTRGKVRNPEASEEELIALIREDGAARFLPMEGGTIFELGGRPVEVIQTPGHSLGSVCFLDRRERLLFTGDTVNDCLLLNFWPMTTSLQEYRDAVARLWERRGEYDYICQGHDCLEKADKSFISDYLEAADQLLSGEAEGREIDDGIHQGLGIYHNKIRLFYDPEHLR